MLAFEEIVQVHLVLQAASLCSRVKFRSFLLQLLNRLFPNMKQHFLRRAVNLFFVYLLVNLVYHEKYLILL